MSPSTDLTQSAVERIHQGHTNFNPTVQVLDVKKIQNSTGGNDRYRLVVSDGKHYQQAMLATQLNVLVANGQIAENGLVCLTEFICNEVQGKKVVIILKLEVVSNSVGVQLGDPVEYAKGGSGGGAQQQSAPAPASHSGGLNTMHPVAQQPYRASAPYGGNSGSASGNNSYGSSSMTSPLAKPAPYAASRGGGGTSSYGGARHNSPIVKQDPGAIITPIAVLNPYVNRWTIKARVTSKSDIRRWNNAKGEGTLFSIDLLDEHGGEIRGTFFKEQCEKFYNQLEAGKVYIVSGGRLKVAQKQYSTLKNQYEITFDNSTTFDAVEDDHKIDSAHYNFRPINQLTDVEPGTIVDIVGIVKQFMQEQMISTKTGRETAKRDIVLVDTTGTEVRLTIWGDKATQNPEQWEGNPVIAIKGVKVSDYNGRSLSTMPGCQIAFQPDTPEAAEVFNWWHQTGSSAVTTSLSTGGSGGSAPALTIDARRYLSDIKDDHLGHGEKPDFLEIKATITFMRSEPDPWYTSCTQGDCKRKVVSEMDGFRCEKCQKSMPSCNYRYILSVTATDISGSQYLTCFDEHACQLLKKTAQELYDLKSTGLDAEYDQAFQEATFDPWIFRLRVKSEQVNDEQRIKCTVSGMVKVDPVRECKELIKAIEQYN